MTYHLIDKFNGRTVSTHRTYLAAEKARRKIVKALRRSSPGSYLPLAVAIDDKDGKGIRIGPNTFYGVGRLSLYEPIYDEQREEAV